MPPLCTILLSSTDVVLLQAAQDTLFEILSTHFKLFADIEPRPGITAMKMLVDIIKRLTGTDMEEGASLSVGPIVTNIICYVSSSHNSFTKDHSTLHTPISTIFSLLFFLPFLPSYLVVSGLISSKNLLQFSQISSSIEHLKC